MPILLHMWRQCKQRSARASYALEAMSYWAKFSMLWLTAPTECWRLVLSLVHLIYLDRLLVNFLTLIVTNTFLWVTFQFKDIWEQCCDDEIRRVFTTCPKRPRKKLERVVERIGSRGQACFGEDSLSLGSSCACSADRRRF